jgi:hypothetical protein
MQIDDAMKHSNRLFDESGCELSYDSSLLPNCSSLCHNRNLKAEPL